MITPTSSSSFYNGSIIIIIILGKRDVNENRTFKCNSSNKYNV